MRKSERRRQLLQSARQLFIRQGLANTTLAQIAQGAAASETIILKHFADTKSIYIEVLKQIAQATLEKWRAEAASTGVALAKLHAIADLYVDGPRVQVLELRLLHGSLLEGQDEDIANCLRSFFQEAENLLAQLIAEGQQSGVFRRLLDPRVGAWELIWTAIGYQLVAPLGLTLYREPDSAAKAVDCFLHGLLKTDV
jgi:AcrR family transcriptional regulator